MFGFVCLLLYAALLLQFECVCVYALHILCTCCTCLPCVWGKPTKGDRTIDRVRVNGYKMVGTDYKDLIQSGG